MSAIYDSIMTGLEEALEYERGESGAYITSYVIDDEGNQIRTRQLIQPLKEYDRAAIKKIREQNGMTQKVFADCLGVSKKTVESWEYGKNEPNGPARRLLALLENGYRIIA